jgi:alpha-N-arabinofuranosidase
MQGLSFHFYTLPTDKWEKKGSATEFGEDQWHSTLAQTLRMETFVQKHGEVMDKYDPKQRIGMLVDEWGTWYDDPEPNNKLGLLFQQNSIRDAVVAGVNLNIFNQHCDRVKMANVAQMLNVLQAVILTDREKMLLTPTYHVFQMYKVHQGATLIPVELSAPEYRLGEAAVPSLHASASRDAAGKLHLSLVNLQPNRAAQVSLKIEGAQPKHIAGQVLTAPAMNAINTFEQPEAVKPAPFGGIKIRGDQITLSVPSKSVVVLEAQ